MAVKALKVHKPYPKPCCPVCERTLKPAELKNGPIYCKVCGSTFEAAIFTPPPENITVRPIAAGVESAAAPCAKHALNAAEGNCERCGNFICALCRTPLEGKNFCPACFERILEKGEMDVAPEREPFSYGMGNAVAFVGLIPPLGVILGPMAIVYCVKWIRQAKARKKAASNLLGVVLTIVLAAVDIAFSAWIALGIFYLIQRKLF